MSEDRLLEFLVVSLRGASAHAEELRALGERRRSALAEAESVLARVEELLPYAERAGLSLAEIARLSAVSRPTLYAIKERRGGARRRPEDPAVATALAEAAAELGIDLSEGSEPRSSGG